MLDYMRSDDSVQRMGWNWREAVGVEVKVEIGFRAVGGTDQLRPIRVAASLDRAVNVADARRNRDGKRSVARPISTISPESPLPMVPR